MADQQSNNKPRKPQAPSDLAGASDKEQTFKSGSKTAGGRPPQEDDDADEDDDTE